MRRPQEQEARYFQAFCEAQPDLCLDAFEHQDKPDFLVRRNSTVVGVEVTRYAPTPQSGSVRPEEQESLRHRVMSLARTAYSADGGPPRDVQIKFSPYYPLNKKRANGLAAEIVNFLRADRRDYLVYEPSGFSQFFKNEFLPEIDYLRAIRVPDECHAAWSPVQMTWRDHAGYKDIHKIVQQKEQKTTSYLDACNELWLLIVFDVLGGTIHVRPPIEPVNFRIPTAFHRIFCLAPSDLRCVEVPVTPLATE